MCLFWTLQMARGWIYARKEGTHRRVAENAERKQPQMDTDGQKWRCEAGPDEGVFDEGRSGWNGNGNAETPKRRNVETSKRRNVETSKCRNVEMLKR